MPIKWTNELDFYLDEILRELRGKKKNAGGIYNAAARKFFRVTNMKITANAARLRMQRIDGKKGWSSSKTTTRVNWNEDLDAKLVSAYGRSTSKIKGQQDVDAARFFLASSGIAITPDAARHRIQHIAEAKREAENAKPAPVAVKEEPKLFDPFEGRPKPLYVYVIGPYDAETEAEIQANIRRAQFQGATLADPGHFGSRPIVPIVPHNMFIGISDVLEPSEFGREYYLDATLGWMLFCEQRCLTPRWLESNGSMREYLVWCMVHNERALFKDEIRAAITGKTGMEIDRIKALLKKLEEQE